MSNDRTYLIHLSRIRPRWLRRVTILATLPFLVLGNLLLIVTQVPPVFVRACIGTIASAFSVWRPPEER